MKYEHIKAKDKNDFSDWIKPKTNKYRLGCCDCGLVHDVKFKADKKQVFFKLKRNNRATGQIRRNMFKKR